MKPRGLALLVVLLLPLALLPSLHFSARDYVLQVLTEMFVFMVLAQSYDIMGGTLGYINLGHIVFFGLGAYAFGMAISLASGMAFALLISYPFFRLRGAYFALATFGLVKLMENVTNNLEPLTGGSSGLKILAANRTVPVYYTSLILVAGALAVAWLVSRSRLGLAMKSIREDEAVARDFGVPTGWVKVQALVLSAAFPAVLGGLFTWYINFINPAEVFGLRIALEPVAMAMLGGSGLVLGPALGAVVLYLAEQYVVVRFHSLQGTMLGGVILLVGLLMPGGLIRLRPLETLLQWLGLHEEDA